MAESVPLRARFTVIAVPNYVNTWDFLSESCFEKDDAVEIVKDSAAQ